MVQKRYRVAVLNSHPIQYFAPLFKYINESDDIELTALYYSDVSVRGGYDRGFDRKVKWDLDLLKGYPFIFVGKKAHELELGGFFRMRTLEVAKALRHGSYDALIMHGHQHLADLIAFVAAKMIGCPVFMHCETHLGLGRSPLRAALRKLALSVLYRSCDGALAIGSANAEFHEYLGVDPARITLFPYAVDNQRFISAASLTSGEKAQIRKKLGLTAELPVLVYASKLDRRKHPDDVLRAAQILAGEGLPFQVVIAGSGEMERDLKDLASEAGMPHVVMPGFINQQEMPRLLAASDIFVLPAHNEPWGLVVNEAMCAGLPIVTTPQVGSARDLVHSGENGLLVNVGDPTELANALRGLIRDPEMRARMGAKSRTIIASWGYAECLAGLRTALERLAPPAVARATANPILTT